MNVFFRVPLSLALLFAATLASGEEPEPDAQARYQAAVQAAEAKFQKRMDEAKSEFLEEVAAARALLEPAQTTPRKTSAINELPVEVTGADPVPLKEGTDQTGWFEIPEAAKGFVIFEPEESEPKDGLVQFKILEDAKIGLAASWAYDGNASGGWQEDRFFKQDLLDRGWKQIGQMYRNQTDRHTLFIRECKKGEVLAVRTRKYNRPYVFVPGVIPAGQQPPSEPNVPADKPVEVVGAEVHDAKVLLKDLESLPKDLHQSSGFESPPAGVAIVRVHRPGKIYVAASWEYDGNPSGQWTEERWSEQAFQEEGFEKLGSVTINHHGTNQEHQLFVRECKAGEKFRIRTRKYGAPYVFVPAAS